MQTAEDRREGSDVSFGAYGMRKQISGLSESLWTA